MSIVKFLKKAVWFVLCITSGIVMGTGLFQFVGPGGNTDLGAMLVMIAFFMGYFLRPQRAARVVR
ncbi:hypothetical protein D3C81_419850 [compost metagenome]|jgi:hypothetical protein|uniref:Uncharacterized protein n=1 Tax=Pseudomonas wadenswilerensis TaxID=1785161 RepID=A0A380T1V5_9PSED|nr:conserved exported protein of unknown function [Pseudomonas sp. JV241A]SUQ63993.1 hypothetical protein CCOS864_03447 [Pseudomonas wadenswilerensis]